MATITDLRNTPRPCPDDALASLIQHYLDGDDRSRKLARLEHARGVHDLLEQVLLERALGTGVPVTADETRQLRAPAWALPTVEVWDCPVPLVLIDLLFAPNAWTAPPPATHSCTVWLRPSSAEAYLHSLATLWALLDDTAAAAALRTTVETALQWAGSGTVAA